MTSIEHLNPAAQAAEVALTSQPVEGAHVHMRNTQALCPECLKALPAEVFHDEQGRVWMERICPEHGSFTTYCWPDYLNYEHLRSFELPETRPAHTFPVSADCPRSCGLCARHRRKVTLAEIEVTMRCNMRCPVCFMAADDIAPDPSLASMGQFLDTVVAECGTDTGLQLTGGEPTVRDDLWQIIELARERGFWGVEVNTNGVRIATEEGYLEKLVGAGLTGVYLQFDGFNDDAYQAIRGRPMADLKRRVVERCREVGVQVVLAMTVVSGSNDDQLGPALRFSLENSDVVAGLALQPAFTSGRFTARRATPLTMGDVIKLLAEQSDGLIEPDDIWPLGMSPALCDTGTFMIRDEDGSWIPATRKLTREQYQESFNVDAPQGSAFADVLAQYGVDVAGGLSIIIMNYMDAVSMDLERLQGCSMLCATADGRMIPFCSYQLTDLDGHRLYPTWGIQDPSALAQVTEKGAAPDSVGAPAAGGQPASEE